MNFRLWNIKTTDLFSWNIIRPLWELSTFKSPLFPLWSISATRNETSCIGWCWRRARCCLIFNSKSLQPFVCLKRLPKRAFDTILSPRSHYAIDVQHFAGIWAFAACRWTSLCGGHIARLRGSGDDLHVMWTTQSQNDAHWFERGSSGSGPFAAVHWRKWEHNE